MGNYTQLFSRDVITHRCPNPDAGLANRCYIVKEAPVIMAGITSKVIHVLAILELSE